MRGVQIDQLSLRARWTLRSIIVAALALALYVYTTTIFLQPKRDYNRVHPFTSFIPITIWIVARNLTPVLRHYSLGLFGWLGCITLETYISQFHTWLHTGIPDGQPKQLLSLFFPNYPLINFALTTAVYVFVSFRLFELTNAFKTVALPSKDHTLLYRNFIIMGGAALLLYAAGAALLQSVTMFSPLRP